MNKKIILIAIISILIIATGLGVFFVFQKPTLTQTKNGKCGDGVCDAKEKSKPKLCPKDCQEIISDTQKNPETKMEPSIKTSQKGTSHFIISIAGFLGNNYESSLDYIKESGADDVRFMSRWGGMHWEKAEPQKGNFDWSFFDERYLAAKQRGLKIMVTLYPSSPQWDNPNSEYDHEYPTDIEEYLKFVRMATERYDGDGKDDAPGSPIVSDWILMEEIERGDGQKWWGGTPAQYADLFVKTYYAIKSANPDATIGTYGANNWLGIKKDWIETITKPVFNEIKKITSDKNDFAFVYSMHYYQTQDMHEYLGNINFVKNMLNDVGLKDNPIIMEDIAPFMKKTDPQKEQKLAKQIITSHIISFANNLKTVGWAQLSDGFEYGENFEAGIISTPNMSKKDMEKSFKNLGFYSYKLMTEKMEGIDWNDIKIIQESDGVYIYQFSKNGRPFWVAWNDNSESKQTTLSNITSSQVKITQAVPKYESGKDVTDYNTAFATEIKTVQNNTASVTLGDVPIFVEEK
ncbi:MAG: hypothetical protein COX35_01705 [Candidatus Nealsonbacteria bacterium CG23_combo_of_CG06-09_8_20_14_all_37_18]|uniref:Glycoside hydrolase family 42 N-terminal domain-containing protein n=1 Tax=Candidatus Nealsonbacteria bacterium CG23_combo_of_CG06-09_8_20_14_all_37_18 TaxID=1974720 RepID=A0A2G9YYD6_9BACT|nr:MAG: hypothetical protein COX35_01705 [Candidatus Nealsonbacteria bacterium CG23_combo_of_CG06-09_8_20_14_all_37_18]